MTGVDIGCQPAMSLAAQLQDHSPARHILNIRWLACSVLAGVSGAVLMGGALFIAFDRQSEFAMTPHAAAASAGAHRNGLVEVGRSDRLALAAERVSSRQLIQETTVRTVGGKEFVQVMPYVRVTASLAAGDGDHSESIPEFNPDAVFAAVGVLAAENEPEKVAAAEEEELLTVSYSAFDPAESEVGSSDALDVAEIEQMLRQTFTSPHSALAYAQTPLLPLSAPGVGGLDRLDLPLSIASSDLVRLASADANTTTVAKRSAPAPTLRPQTKEHEIVVNQGDTLMSILVGHGTSRAEALEIIARVEEESGSTSLGVGDKVRLTMAPDGDDRTRMRPVAVRLPEETTAVAVGDSASFLRQLASLGSLNLRRTSAPVEPIRPAAPAASDRSSRANVHKALYQTGLAHDVPRDLIDELVRIFVFDVDFQRSVSLGDEIELFYAESGEDHGTEEPEILFAEITLRGESHRFYRFRHPEDGIVGYYDETGNSAKKFLIRKPISGGTFRSGFGNRRHPILGYSRMHYGVDWAARTGTPIMAAGGGTVIEAQWRSGYGKHVRIRHANGYETSYSHMSGFGDGIQPGARVYQGQVIGYVGSTGMSTGPHLHYEVMVNGRHVDPMRIRLPRGRSLEGRVLAAFEKEMTRIDALMNRAPTSTRMASR